MTVQRIDDLKGYQARVHVTQGQRLTRFFADVKHGGKRKAHTLAKLADIELQRKAERLRRRVKR